MFVNHCHVSVKGFGVERDKPEMGTIPNLAGILGMPGWREGRHYFEVLVHSMVAVAVVRLAMPAGVAIVPCTAKVLRSVPFPGTKVPGVPGK